MNAEALNAVTGGAAEAGKQPATGTRVAKPPTRETRVTRLSGKIKIMLLFGFYHECLHNQPLVLFKTLHCLNYNGAKK